MAENHYEIPFNHSSNQQQGQFNRKIPAREVSKWNMREKMFAAIVLLLLATLVGLGVFNIIKSERTPSQRDSENLQVLNSGATSCLELQKSGVLKSGYYLLKSLERGESFEAYCEMETSGGGWSLVATINDNDVKRKCTVDDVWFSSEPISAVEPYVSRLWENKNVVGQLEKASTSDYKNQGYYSIKASDVLVRHIPNHRDIEESKGKTFLEYHSTNGFLNQYGGNLYNVYSNYFPLTPTTADDYPSQNNEVLDSLAANASHIISDISNFYQYQYGDATDKLEDGGSNMFTSYGMQVYYNFQSCSGNIYYEREYLCSSVNSVISSRKTYPYFALASIGENDYFRSSSYIRISSNRPSNDATTRYSGGLEQGNYELRYNAYCRYGGNIPSLCDVFYVVNNTKDWKSSVIFTFPTPSLSSYTRPTGISYTFSQYVQNYPFNVALGYTMLSRRNGLLVSNIQVEGALRKILAVISKFPEMFAGSCSNSSLNLIVPVTYTAGGNLFSNHVPPSLRTSVTSGYMQFRARALSGNFYAFCPAVKVNTCLPQFFCVGGVKDGRSSSSQSNDCSDFLHWDGGESTSSLNFNQAIRFAHSLQDIQSTIMIFYR